MTSFLPLSSERRVEQRLGASLDSETSMGPLVGPEHQTDVIDNLEVAQKGRERHRPLLAVLFFERRREIDRDPTHVGGIGEPVGAQARGEDRRREAVA